MGILALKFGGFLAGERLVREGICNGPEREVFTVKRCSVSDHFFLYGDVQPAHFVGETN
jgi:hypothetical protein